jgi:amino acid transporter
MFVRRRRRPRATLARASGPPGPVQSAAHPAAPKLISWTALALLTVGSVANLGSAPPLAVVGLAGMISWLDGPSEGLLLIGRKQGFLPPYFQKVNRYGIEVRIIAAQGVVITLIAVLYAFIPSVSHAYWVFTALATQVYLLMYVLMFIAAIKLRRSQPDHPGGLSP